MNGAQKPNMKQSIMIKNQQNLKPVGGWNFELKANLIERYKHYNRAGCI